MIKIVIDIERKRKTARRLEVGSTVGQFGQEDKTSMRRTIEKINFENQLNDDYGICDLVSLILDHHTIATLTRHLMIVFDT